MVNKFDTQFLIEGSDLDEDNIRAGIWPAPRATA